MSKAVHNLKYQTTLGERIRRILEVISPILVDGNITFSSSGLSIHGMTNGIYLKLQLPSSGAESFQCWDETVSIGLDFKCLAGWLKAVSKGDIISFEVSKKTLETNKTPTLTYKHWNDRMNHEVRLPILDIEEFKEGKEEKLEYDTVITMPSVQLENFLKRHSVGATDIRFQSICQSAEKGRDRVFLVLHSFGVTPGETTMPCFKPNFIGEYKDLNVSCLKEDKFSIKTLKAVTKAYTISDSVNVFLSKDRPLRLTYQLGQLGSLEFLVLPTKKKDEHAGNKDTLKRPAPPPSKLPKRKKIKKKIRAVKPLEPIEFIQD
jgi:hypothetical protein